jgi:SepF-like predicted cell division protein (DUF552 family)
MVFDRIKGIARKGMEDSQDIEQKEEYFEVNVGDKAGKQGKISIVIEKLNDFSDTERVLKAIRNGSIVFLRIKNLKEKDLGELKRSVERLKKAIMANNGDIAGIEEDWLVLTPEYANVER